MEESLALLALSRLKALSLVQKKWIFDTYESVADVFTGKARPPQGTESCFRDTTQFTALEKERSKIQKSGVEIITIRDTHYPELLRQIPDPPVILYCKGSLCNGSLPRQLQTFSMVGARKATLEGIALAERIAETLSSLGITIVSGLARGIDTASHRGALRGKGKTIGVLGCGIDICYPSENLALFQQMSKEGAVITEYTPGERPWKSHFPERNRIIAGLSLGVLVVEASAKSGSLITARLALEYGRDVMAIPGRVFDEAYRGANSLIKQGARLVEDISDIVDYCFPEVKVQEQARVDMDGDEDYIYRLMGLDRIHVDELIEKSQLEARKVIALLTRLEMKDLVQPISGGFYMRKI
jgi:DNA processing protein